jgi:hypothetical protein
MQSQPSLAGTVGIQSSELTRMRSSWLNSRRVRSPGSSGAWSRSLRSARDTAARQEYLEDTDTGAA